MVGKVVMVRPEIGMDDPRAQIGEKAVVEFEDGTFVLLSPDASPSDDRIHQRFRELWEERGSESGLTVDHYQGKQELPPMEDAA